MDVSKYLVPEELSISEAVKAIDEGKRKVVFCLRGDRLSGCFTDGDMRLYPAIISIREKPRKNIHRLCTG